MAKEKRKFGLIAVLLLFVVYFFIAARPIPMETILTPRWLTSLGSDYPVFIGENVPGPETEAADSEYSDTLLPFTLGNRFGYVDSRGRFSLNRIKTGYVSLAETYWSEYEAEPEILEVHNPFSGETIKIEKGRGYPFFLDNRIFLIGEEQTTLSALDNSGAVLWTYDFAAPLTCIDAAGGIILTGSLDGVVEIISGGGKQLFFFEPGGSRLSVILGCTVSRDGSRLGIISGIDEQRFLLLERFGGPENSEYKVVYHEFLEDGFRRAVHVSFIDEDNWIIFEREGGLGMYKINNRSSFKIPLAGEITAIDNNGGGDLLFIITSPREEQKKLIALRLPGRIVMEAPFKSGTAFLGRSGSRIYVGGGMTLAAFELEKR
ncbi:MAG: WD40 repeat domain-containing protein [Treponema sp.]|nr:WD40 repeat domain-containing protein [Treponema sp.]